MSFICVSVLAVMPFTAQAQGDYIPGINGTAIDPNTGEFVDGPSFSEWASGIGESIGKIIGTVADIWAVISGNGTTVQQLKKLNNQQIIQHATDQNRTEWSENNITARIAELDRYSSYLMQGGQYFSCLNDIGESWKIIRATIEELASYKSYLEVSGNEFSISSADMIYRNFADVTKELYDNLDNQIKGMRNFKQLRPLEVLEALDEMASSLAGTVISMRTESITRMADLCYQVSVSNMVESNRRFMSMDIM